jgi:hypothetical protein
MNLEGWPLGCGLYGGLIALLLGGLFLLRPPHFLGIHTRSFGSLLFGLGLFCFLAALLWPVPGTRTANGPPAAIDETLPRFQFEELHEREVHASAEKTFEAIQTVTADEIRLLRFFTWLRNPSRSLSNQGTGLLNPAPATPILEEAKRSGFILLRENPGREIVLGAILAAPRSPVPRTRPPTPAEFIAISSPGFVKTVINFRVEPLRDGVCRLATETRVLATDARAARRFAVYWRFIFPGSAILRGTWLAAIARRAESRVAASP